MASSISGMPSFDPGMLAQMREKMFAKLDADGDGSLTKTELEAASKADKTSGRKGPDASKMIADFDTDGDGSLSKTEMDAGFKKIDDKMRSAFLQMQEATSNDTDTDVDKLFASLDSDGDGSVSKTELSDGADKLKQAFGPPPGPPPGGGAGGPPPAGASTEEEEEDSTTASDALFDVLDTNKDGSVSASELAAGADKAREKRKAEFGPPPPPPDETGSEETSGADNVENARQQMMSFLLSLQEQLKAA